MNICLKTWARQESASEVTVCLHDRLPAWIRSPCSLTTVVKIEEQAKHYRLSFRLQGTIAICCQRCFEWVDYTYTHQNNIVVLSCDAELVRHSLDEDCIVANAGEINWLDVVTDELHLYAPEIPHARSECDIMF